MIKGHAAAVPSSHSAARRDARRCRAAQRPGEQVPVVAHTGLRQKMFVLNIAAEVGPDASPRAAGREPGRY